MSSRNSRFSRGGAKAQSKEKRSKKRTADYPVRHPADTPSEKGNFGVKRNGRSREKSRRVEEIEKG